MNGDPCVVLRALSASDAELYVTLYGDPEVMRYIGAPLAPDAARAATARDLAAASCGQRRWVVLDDARTPLGLVGGNRRGSHATLGVMLLPAARGRGVAVAALHAAAGRLWAEGVHSIELAMGTENVAMIAAALRLAARHRLLDDAVYGPVRHVRVALVEAVIGRLS